MTNRISFISVALLMAVALIGCLEEKTVQFKVTNLTADKIDTISIMVSSYSHTKCTFSLPAYKTVVKSIAFDDRIQSDAGYVVHCTQNRSPEKIASFGYISNGAPLERRFRINVYSDTIKVKSPWWWMIDLL